MNCRLKVNVWLSLHLFGWFPSLELRSPSTSSGRKRSIQQVTIAKHVTQEMTTPTREEVFARAKTLSKLVTLALPRRAEQNSASQARPNRQGHLPWNP